jgi:exodeoxyribonuclease V gamma subunit
MAGLTTFLALNHQSLANQLARDLAPGGSRVGQGNARNPFLKDIIIVDGKALSNWLTHGLVVEGGMGIQMNAELMNTRRFGPWLASLLRPASCPNPKQDPLDGLPARIFRLLDGESPLAVAWAAYSGKGDETNGEAIRWGLSFRLAQHFGDLLRNDPDWIHDAEGSKSKSAAADRWKQLWWAISEELKKEFSNHAPLHEVHVLSQLEGDTDGAVAKVAKALPGRISLFSTGDIPRTLLTILEVLSSKVDVRIYHLQPTLSFHEDIQKGRKHAKIGDDDYAFHSDSPGFPLLLSCGRYFAAQQRKLLDLGSMGYVTDKSDPFVLATLLEHLKYSVNTFDTWSAPEQVAETDSISIHRCHGIRREVEVMRDELLRVFSTDADIKQGDILILSPNPEVYAPLIEGILGARSPGFRVRTAGLFGAKNSPFGALVKLLAELPLGRVSADDIYSLLSMRAMQAKLRWGSSELDQARRWIEEAPFYWGLNAKHRRHHLLLGEETIPKSGTDAYGTEEVGTFNDLLKRVSLGTAFGGKVRVVSEALPLEGVAGQEGLRFAYELSTTLGHVQVWLEFALTNPEGQTLSKWVEKFGELGDALLPRDKDYSKQYGEFRMALAQLKKQAALMAVDEVESPMSKSLFAEILLGQCEFAAGSGQFMTGDVTVSGLRAASIHPAKVVVLLGMNDGAFPQAQRSPGPEVADADTQTKASILAKEATSMHAFLLALLAAQRRVIVTFDGYVGASGKRAAAALPVELLRAACQQLAPDFRLKVHGLTSFQPPVSPEAGKEQVGGATYDRLAASLPDLLKGEQPMPVLKPSRRFSMDMPIDDFIAFWRDPSAFALRQLSVKVPRKNDSIDSDEPLDAGATVKYEAINWVEKAKRDHREDISKITWSEAKLSGRFPPGKAGRDFFNEILAQQVGGLTGIHVRIKTIAEVVSMSELLEVPNVSWTDFKPYLYPPASPTKLIVQLNREMDKDEESLFRSLAMWAYLYQTYPGLNEITVVGLPKIEVTPAGNGGDKTSMALRIRLTEVGRAELAAGFAELMGLALDGDSPAYMKLAAKAFMKRRPNKEGDSYESAKIDQNDVTGKFGVVKNSAAKLLLPEVFKLDALTKLIEKMVVEGGMTRFTDKFIPPLKIKKSDEKKSQPKTSTTKVQPSEVLEAAPEPDSKTKTIRSRSPKPPKST